MSREVHNTIDDFVGCVKRISRVPLAQPVLSRVLPARSRISPSPLMGEGRTSTSSVESGEGEGSLRDVETSDSPSPPVRLRSPQATPLPRGERGANAGVLRTPYKAAGFTLVELLVTLVIIMMLTAVAVPVLAPALAGRRQREASREVTSYFTLARDTAMRTGRATGVMLERFTGAGNASAKALILAGQPLTPVPEMCLTLWQVEVPPPYSGDTLYSRALVGLDPNDGLTKIWSLGTTQSEGYGLVRIGDYIKFNTQGHQYQILNGTIDTSISPNPLGFLAPPLQNSPWVIVPVGGTTALPPVFIPTALPYQIMRQPVKTSTPPLQLPEGIVIDLASSGTTPASTATTFATTFLTSSFCPLDLSNSNQPQFPTDVIPIVVLFSPTGSVERIAFSGPDASSQPTPYAMPPTTPIFFLVGQREKIPAAGNANNENWRDPTSLWISIFPRTGLVTSTENAPPSSLTVSTAADLIGGLSYARRLAIEGQTLGGR